MPPEGNSGASTFCPSVILSVTVAKNFNRGHNFWTVRETDFIYGMHTQIMKPF